MIKQKLLNGLKVIIILLLSLGILFLVIIQWKSDAVVKKVIALMQSQMQDSLRYDDLNLEWFRHFPSASLHMSGLHIGSTKDPLITGGNVDVVLRLFPLLQEKIVINKLLIRDSHITIAKKNGKWTYDIFKKGSQTEGIEKANVKNDTSGWQAMVRHIEFENSLITYANPEGIKFSMEITDGNIRGNLSRKLIDANIKMSGSMSDLVMDSYKQAGSLSFDLDGDYKYETDKGLQQLIDWKIENENITLEAAGSIQDKDNQRWMDIHVEWADADPQFLKSILPPQEIKNWNDYIFSGESFGQIDIKGPSSKTESPHLLLATELKKGSIKFPGDGGQLKNMLLNIAYDNGKSKSSKGSYLRANLRSGSFQGNTLKGEMRMDNLEQPVLALNMEGSLPASLLNMVLDSVTWNFKSGVFDIDNYEIKGLNIKTVNARNFIEKSIVTSATENLRLIYSGNEIVVDKGKITLDNSGNMKLSANELFWNKAKGEDVDADLNFTGDKIDFKVNGKHSQGNVNATGSLTGLGTKPVLNADWKIKGIEMQELLASFDNFDQTFITTDHLNGKADIWSHSTIPYDLDGNIKLKEVEIKAAIDIKDGKLQGLKTLEDFSKYIHLDDLKEIRFNQIRNYLKIEDGKVFLPVMFIQSSAINMSINGVHSFNQDILYNLKINAGQAAANKLKKFDPLKRFKQARKSGWINLYYVLSGNVDNVQYEQDQKQVISSFEQSSALKESMRKYLVDRFGHDVYWIEPNEWEDIPEYK